MAKLLVELSENDMRELMRLAERSGQTPDEVASALIAQAMEPWSRGWEVLERARAHAAMTDDDAMALALAEVEEMRRERRRSA